MKFKRSLTLIISVVLIFSTLSVIATASSQLTDIDGHWGKSFIQELNDKGIIGGYPDGTFLPDNPITRAEFCTIITKALKYINVITDYVNTIGTFSDVPADLWSVKYIETAYAFHFVGGIGNGLFDPEALITRQEMAKIISLVYCEIHKGQFNQSFAELLAAYNRDYRLDWINADKWAIDYIKVATQVGLVRGDGEEFKPLFNVSRAETATVTYILIKNVPVITDPPSTATINPTAKASR